MKFAIENEAIVLTTSGQACEKLQVRLHSAQGVVYELPPDLARQRQPKAAGGAIGGMGGFLGPAGGAPIPAGGLIAGEATLPGKTAVSQSTADGDVLQTGAAPPGQIPPAAPDVEGDADGTDFPFVADPATKFKFVTRRQSTNTANETIRLIQQTIQPDTWEDLSGPGSILYFPSALGFTVRQTQAMHEEIEELLDRLRELPPAFGEQTRLAPAKIPVVGPNDIDNWDMLTLVNMIKTVIEPDTWDDLSGPGSVQMYAPKLVLSVHQTQEVHREIRNLLTSLRRARYLARQGRRWTSFGVAEGPWFTGVLGLTDIPPGTRQSELPEAEPDVLGARGVLG